MVDTMTFTDCAHNMLFSLNREKWLQDLAVSSRADLVGYCEAEGKAQRATLVQHCKAAGRGLWQPEKGNQVSWRADVFALMEGEEGVVGVHRSATAMGVPAKVNPARSFSFVGLRHLRTGRKLLRINVHPIAGALKVEPNEWTPELNQWKDWAIRQYWLDVVRHTARQMSRETWDAILMGGDFNGRLENRQRWWYPGPMLDGLYVLDDAPRAIDRLVHTHDSYVKQVKRWAVGKGIHSDHNLHFAEYQWRPGRAQEGP